jgi:OsmC-like protein
MQRTAEAGDHTFPVRVQRTNEGSARAYARGQAFDVDSQASLRESDPSPSAVEYALGALGADLVCGFQRVASARHLKVHAIELSLTGRLDNVLVHLGVIGEAGHAGLSSIDGTVYVSADAGDHDVEDVWRASLERSPLFNTFSRCATVDITLRVMP